MTEAFRPQTSVVFERMGDETIVVHLETGRYFTLEASAADIWSAIIVGSSRAAILGHFGGGAPGHEDAPARVAAFIDELLAEDLIVASEAPAEAPPLPELPASFALPSLQKYSDMEELLKIDPVHEVDEYGWPKAARHQAA